MLTATHQTITIDAEQLQIAAERLGEKFDLDPNSIDVLKWLNQRVESLLDEAEYFVTYRSDVPLKRG